MRSRRVLANLAAFAVVYTSQENVREVLAREEPVALRIGHDLDRLVGILDGCKAVLHQGLNGVAIKAHLTQLSDQKGSLDQTHVPQLDFLLLFVRVLAAWARFQQCLPLLGRLPELLPLNVGQHDLPLNLHHLDGVRGDAGLRSGLRRHVRTEPVPARNNILRPLLLLRQVATRQGAFSLHPRLV